METLFVVALLVVLLLYLASQRTSKPRNAGGRSSVSREQRILDENLPWLRERWQAAQEIDEGDTSIFPKWYFDDATEAQLRRIEETGLTISGGTPTKGQASDIIGLFEPVEEEHAEMLKFFGISVGGMNQSKARHQVALLQRDPANVERWETRPASQIEREFYRFVGLKAPKGLTHKQAEKDSYDSPEGVPEEKIEEWQVYSDVWDSLCDADTRADYGIKKPSLALFRDAWTQLRAEGVSTGDLEDLDALVDRLLELKPELNRE